MSFLMTSISNQTKLINFPNYSEVSMISKAFFNSALVRLLVVFALLFLLGCDSGGGSSDNSGDETAVETADETIDELGGTITLPSGFTLDFPEGATELPVAIKVEKTTLPAALPENITAVSSAYKIDAENVKLNEPAKIIFPAKDIDPSISEGEISVYRWDGSEWTVVGGWLKDNTVIVSVDSFSVFILGTGRALHFPVEFDNFWVGEPVIVKVYRYTLAHPDIDAPISAAKSTVVFPPPNNWPEARMYLPQGSYSFCFEWDEDNIAEDKIERYYAFHGSLPGSPAATLHENSSYVVPESVSLNYTEKYLGRCPVPQQMTGDEESTEDAEDSDFFGTYNALDPNRTSAAYRAIFTFNADGTFTGTEWIDGVQSSFNGTWSFDPATQTLNFGVPGGGSMSGPVIGSTNNFVINGTWANGDPGQLQMYR
jgi:hypothetical protein